jgi:hypothetical protein
VTFFGYRFSQSRTFGSARNRCVASDCDRNPFAFANGIVVVIGLVVVAVRAVVLLVVAVLVVAARATGASASAAASRAASFSA